MNAIAGFACRNCEEFYEDYQEAVNCCRPPSEVWQCSECETQYTSEEAAELCCAEDQEEDD